MNLEWKPIIKEFYQQALVYMPQLLSGIIIFAAFWVGSVSLKYLILRGGLRARRIDVSLVRLLARTAQISLLIFGGVTALGTVGVQVGALVAGLGLSGFALGFALRDALSNLLAGVSILLYRPFHLGDRIAVSGLEGAVAEIDLRYTTLDDEGKKILIPNSNLFTNSVIVFRKTP